MERQLECLNILSLVTSIRPSFAHNYSNNATLYIASKRYNLSPWEIVKSLLSQFLPVRQEVIHKKKGMLRNLPTLLKGKVVGRTGHLNRFSFSTRKRTATKIVSIANDVPKYPWIQQTDPNGSGNMYYWNQETDETTYLGSPRPNHWVEVQDPNGSNAVYWWNPESNETTAVGEPRPDLFAARYISIPVVTNDAGIRPFGMGQSSNLDVQRAQQQQQQLQQPSFGKTLVIYAGFGVGMTLAMIAVRGIFGF